MIGWLDCSAGMSGDMLLGALVDVGVPLAVLQAAIDVVAPEPVLLTATTVTRAGIGATHVRVETAASTTPRTWADVRQLLTRLDGPVAATAAEAFRRLAEAEAHVHRVAVDDVHFHEVGALDAIADVVGAAAGLQHLGLSELVVSPVAVGSGTTRGAHGPLPVPVPAVLALLTGVPVHSGAVAHESCTPTGAALVAATASSYGALPAMTVTRSGTGAGGRDPAEVANVVRLVIGDRTREPSTALMLETNVDDLDPRLWPTVLERLMAAGASDAWLTPILMKKGRPAHTLSVLLPPEVRQAVLRVVFTETTTIGVREWPVDKTALARTETTVEVDGQVIRVKLVSLDGAQVNAMPEYDDVVAAATALGQPVKRVLAQAQARCRD